MQKFFYLIITINLILVLIHWGTQFSESHGRIKGEYIQPEILLSFSVPTLANDTINMKNLVKENDFIVLNFWTTWCEPCVNEIKFLNFTREKFLTQKIKFIAISCDNSKKIVSDFLKSNQFDFEQLYLKDIQSPYDLWTTFSQYDETSSTLNLAQVKMIPLHVFFNCKTKKVKVIKTGFYNEKDFEDALNAFIKK